MQRKFGAVWEQCSFSYVLYRKSQRFGATQGWINNDLGWIITLTLNYYIYVLLLLLIL